MTGLNVSDYLLMALPLAYYLNIDVKDTINYKGMTYVTSTFKVIGIVLLNNEEKGYQIKDIRYGITLNVTEHFIKKYFVKKL